MRIDLWSDVVCPWCLLGKRRLERALASFEHADNVEVVLHSFELDHSAPEVPVETTARALAAKYGAEQLPAMFDRLTSLAADEGLHYRLDETPRIGTRAFHRVLHAALQQSTATQRALADRLMLDHFERAVDIADHDYLRATAAEFGLAADVVDSALTGEYDAEVQADIDQARAYGAQGVPFFVIDNKYGISGAQATETFAAAVRQAWTERTEASVQH